MNFLTALLPLLAGFTQPLKDWWNYKQQAAKADQDYKSAVNDYKLAVIQSQTEQAKQQSISDSNDLNNRLNATTQEFKQNTFWLLCVPVIFTMFFPNKAAIMWANFQLIPDWFQWLFKGVYASIWGFPLVKGGYGAITDYITSKREYKLEKARINRQAVFDSLKEDGLFKGSQDEVNKIDKALDKGEQNE